MKTRIFILILSVLLVLPILGCTLTLVTEDDKDEDCNVRLTNNSGRDIEVKMDDGSYHHIEDGDSIYVPASKGKHTLEYEDYSRNNTRSNKQVFTFSIDADVEIIIEDDSITGTLVIKF